MCAVFESADVASMFKEESGRSPEAFEAGLYGLFWWYVPVGVQVVLCKKA